MYSINYSIGMDAKNFVIKKQQKKELNGNSFKFVFG